MTAIANTTQLYAGKIVYYH